MANDVGLAVVTGIAAPILGAVIAGALEKGGMPEQRKMMGRVILGSAISTFAIIGVIKVFGGE